MAVFSNLPSSIDSKIYLFKDGVVNEELTGGITLQGVTLSDGKLNFAVNSSSFCYFNKQIPTEGFKLGVEFINNYSGNDRDFLVCQTPLDNSYTYISFAKQFNFISNRKNQILIDTQGEPTQVRLFNSYGASGDCVTKIWLEKD